MDRAPLLINAAAERINLQIPASPRQVANCAFDYVNPMAPLLQGGVVDKNNSRG